MNMDWLCTGRAGDHVPTSSPQEVSRPDPRAQSNTPPQRAFPPDWLLHEAPPTTTVSLWTPSPGRPAEPLTEDSVLPVLGPHWRRRGPPPQVPASTQL